MVWVAGLLVGVLLGHAAALAVHRALVLVAGVADALQVGAAVRVDSARGVFHVNDVIDLGGAACASSRYGQTALWLFG